MIQDELVDLYDALCSDMASNKNTMHLQKLRRAFKDFLTLYHLPDRMVFIMSPVGLN